MQTGDPGKYADVNGIRMYYEIHGKGFPLVLIHGGGSTIYTTFGTILPLLAENHQVVAVELQAHGHTQDRNAPESFEQDADDVAALLKNIGIYKADIFGFSNGGNTAMQIAIRHPSAVNKLVIASSFYKRDGMQDWFWKFMPQAELKNMPALLKEAFLKINPDTNALLAMHNKDRDRMLTFKDWPDSLLRSITMPTLLLVGDNDVMKPEHTVAMYRLIPNARMVVLPGGHGEYLGEETMLNKNSRMPEFTVSLVEEFLSGTFKEPATGF